MQSESRVSQMAAALSGSEILRIAGEIRALSATGRKICNLTVGDFAPSEFRIPELLERATTEALRAGETNYPPSDGVLTLRQAIVHFYERWLGLKYPVESVLVTGGGRPGIYCVFRALVDPGDVVVYSVPSWNNNHYVHLAGARDRAIVCDADNGFLPTPRQIESAARGARLLVLNSPLNPTGTAFSAETLAEICDVVLAENARRGAGERPLFLLYDHIYWMLTEPPYVHVDPVSLRPAMRDYTVFVDGISKGFAATGMRVGWTVGPADITERMAATLGHIGAWAPRAEQVATAQLLKNDDVVSAFRSKLQNDVDLRLNMLRDGLEELRSRGFPVATGPPMGSIYLSARFALHGRRTPQGNTLRSNEDIRRFLLEAAGVAVVPFQAFGLPDETGWFRLSVGAVSVSEIEAMFERLEDALQFDTAVKAMRE